MCVAHERQEYKHRKLEALAFGSLPAFHAVATLKMSYRVTIQDTASDSDWKQRIMKECARIDKPGAKPDPFAHSLSTILSAPSAKPQPVGGSQLSAASRSSRGSATASRVSAASRASAAAAPAPAVAPRASSQLSAAPRRAASELSVRSSQYSLRTPSTIRSDDPSAIARNKIAELELRLELERVVRLERENELEDQRRQTLEAESKLASQTKAKAAANPGAPGKAHQIALLG